MKLGVRGKLFLASVLVIAVAMLVAIAFLSGQLRSKETARIKTELRRHAQLVAAHAAEVTSVTPELLDALADRLGVAAEARVTLIAPGGRVLGDSELTVAELAAVDNHSQRPEVVAALAHGDGESRRYSTTLRTEMMYVAVRWPTAQGIGVARVATPLREVEQSVQQLRTLLLGGGALAVGLALVMSLLASQLLSKELRELVKHARAIAAGDSRRRVEIYSEDEIGGLAGSLNTLAEEVDRSVGKLARERARLAAVLENMGDAVIALNTRSRVELVNPRALELLGVDNEVIGKTMLELARAPELQQITAVAQGGDSAVTELELPNNGRIVQATATPQSSGAGCVVVLHDVTDIRRLERVRQDFVANVSHELRTPVAVIRANAETLMSGALQDATTGPKLVEAQLRHAERLSRIIADLLDLSRLDSGRHDMEIEAVEIAAVARHAAQIVEQAATDRQINLSVVIDSDLRAYADRKALDQVLVNLLDNAVKYSPEGSRVRVYAERTGDSLAVTVQDNGPGIPPQHRERVFERFYRVDAGRSRDLGGTGLGLAIVKHLAENMGGQIRLSDAAPQGAAFSIILPAA